MLTMLEQRVTLLERRLAQLLAGQSNPEAKQQPLPSRMTFLADDPAVIFSGAYQLERGAGGEAFVWLGGPGNIQIVLPLAPREKANCNLRIHPHGAADLSKMAVHVNDAFAPHTLEQDSLGPTQLSFGVEKSSANAINIVLSNVTSVRPSDLGEGPDSRLLAFVFVRADVDFVTTTPASGS